MAKEILYCARCHRVILPREIDEGAYHFVDGDPVCSECFTRLSRRLRPVSGGRAESDTQPIPVNLTDLENELSKGSQATRVPEGRRRERFSSGRLPLAAAPYRTGQVLFMAFCFVIGVLLGGIAYSAYPVDRDKDVPETVPPPAPEKVPPSPAKVSAPETSKPEPGATVKLPPAADAYVRGGKHSAERFGKTPELKVKKADPEFTREVFLRFDLSKVDREVTGAHLLLHVVGSQKAEGIKHEARLVADHTWDDKTLNWSTKPSTGTPFASWDPLKETPVKIDVGEQVKAALKGNRQLSIGINAVKVTVGWVNYGSREAGEARGPVLVLENSSKKLVAPEKPIDPEKPEPKPSTGEKTVRLPAEADAHVTGGKQAEVNKGKRSVLYVLNGLSPDEEREAYIRFDLKTVKGEISKAEIRLHPLSVKNSASATNHVRLVTNNSWEESAVVWKGKPAAGKAFKTWVPQVGTPVVIDVAEHARKAMKGDKKLSINIRITGAGKRETWVTYGSRDGDKAQGPELIVVTK